ncbi:hypothetical protein JXJ21_01590 [candidate division KSB1 bacterium]|nr:hypothetical protein [candidate division KSB1 bacterium]
MKILILHNDRFPCDTDNENWGNSFIINSGHISLYPYTWFFDPFLAAHLSENFSIHQAAQIRGGDVDDRTLLVIPHRNGDIPDQLLRKHIERRRKLILIDARPEQLRFHLELSAIESEDRFLSNCETWTIGENAERWQYPQGISFETLKHIPAAAKCYSKIGEWQDMVHFKNIVWTATDAVHAFELYRQDYSEIGADGFVGQFLRAFIGAVRSLLGEPLSADETQFMQRSFEIRRDFQSLGFCHRTLHQAYHLEGESPADDPIPRMVHAAAQRFIQNQDENEARSELKELFQYVKKQLDALFPFKRYFIDGIHGGITYKDYGFAEYDYPEKSNKYIQMYLDYAERFDYRFNLQIGMSTHEEVARRNPEFYRKLKSHWDQGRMEIVDGSYGQQYPELCSIESNLRQYIYGQLVSRALFGRTVRHHVRQEFGFTPQHPGILQGAGFETVLHRTQNWGATPKENVPLISWKGLDGAAIPAVTSTAADDEHHPVDFFLHLANFFHQTKKHGVSTGIYSNFLDLFWCPPFREDVIRAATYGGVLGEFVTMNQLPERIGTPSESRSYKLTDYQYTIFSQYGWGGSFYSSLNLCARTENLLRILESHLAGTNADAQMKATCRKQIDADWKILCAFQNHDSFCVPQTTVGGHSREYRGVQGPGRRYTEVEIGAKLVTEAYQNLLHHYLDFMRTLYGESSNPGVQSSRMLVFNPLPWRIQQSGSCKMIHIKDLPDHLSEQNLEIALHDLPPMAATVKRIETPRWERGHEIYIENDCWRVEIDSDAGRISRIANKATGRDILSRGGMQFRYTNANQILLSADFYESEGATKVELKGQLRLPDDLPVAYFHVKVVLAKNSRRIDFETRLSPGDAFFEHLERFDAPFSKMYHKPDDQWTASIQGAACLAESWNSVKKIYLNVLENPGQEKFQSVDAAVVLGSDGCLIFHNQGNQHYIWRNSELSNVFLHSREEQRIFRNAIEYVDSEALIFRRIAEFQFQPLLIPVAETFTFDKTSSSFAIDAENVIATSVIALPGADFLVRVAETTGTATDCVLRFEESIQDIEEVNHLGEPAPNSRVTNGAIRLNPWEIKTLRVRK